ncbi:MAG: NAD-dependent dihydropyrimidine dehydrogenase subunit PreA, partial [Bacteroidales bacterium]|nr:NAD-dependent dihydropyrimidine dehydrogenase subunit PreA [Bacteroidales bacterium]
MRTLHLNEEAERCLLCENAPCSKACKNADPARALRAIRFDNAANSWKWLKNASEEELEAAENACIHYDRPVRIREISKIIAEQYGNQESAKTELPSLEIDFCGLHCENPFFLASSAICTNYEMVAAAFEAGWAGVFYKTICLEEIKEVSPRFDVVKNPDGSFAGFRNMEQLSENPADVDFEILKALKRNYPGKIVVASIMGNTEQQWIDLAIMAEEAGVDAIE